MKKNLNSFAILALIIAVAGCTSSQQDAASRQAELTQPESATLPPTKENDADAPQPALPPSMKAWIPKYIQTGLASGIMLEFTGVKKDKPLHARYAGIEVRRYPPAPAAAEDVTKELALNQKGNDALEPSFDLHQAEPTILNATINDVKQAFFKIAPGRYLVRQNKEWADRIFICDVIVREGNYSVITIPVRIPGSGQP